MYGRWHLYRTSTICPFTLGPAAHLVHPLLCGNVVGKIVCQQVVVRVGDGVHQRVEVCGAAAPGVRAGAVGACGGAGAECSNRAAGSWMPPAAPGRLTVGPAKLPGADHVDHVQEAIVGLEVGTLLAQLQAGRRARQSAASGRHGRADAASCLPWTSGRPGAGADLHVALTCMLQAPERAACLPPACCLACRLPRPTPAHLWHAVCPCAKDEHVVLPNLIRDLNVGAVHGACTSGATPSA